MKTVRVNDDVTVLNDYLEVPGLGFLPVNAFVLHAAQPVVIDTGLGLPDRNFLEQLGVGDSTRQTSAGSGSPTRIGITPAACSSCSTSPPNARLITTFAAAGIMSTERPLPMDRLYFLNPGQSLDVGDRTLTAFRPPLFDNPATVGFFDDSSGSCFSSDCFGAPLSSAEDASADDVRDIGADDLAGRQRLWASVDSPWVSTADPVKFSLTVDPLAEFGPEHHLQHPPPARDRPHRRNCLPPSGLRRASTPSSDPTSTHSSRSCDSSNRPASQTPSPRRTPR